ncbi:MAG: hypothetical protein WKF92_10695 [Pyrinomonadaceae bacterium]
MLLEQTEEKKGVNKIMIIGGLIGVVLIAAAIFAMSFRPSMEDQMASILEGSFREGSPEFERITKDIIISTDPSTVQSPNGLGKISMFIAGTIRNKGTSLINGLEVNVAVVDSFNKVLKEKRQLVVPTKSERLKPNETITVNVNIDGFDKNDDRANIRWKVTAIRIEE